jgi:DNA polymerase-3 subunit beta
MHVTRNFGVNQYESKKLRKRVKRLKLIIDKNDLLDGLNMVSKAVANRDSTPILECILIKTVENGIKLTANNLELGIETAAINAKIEAQGITAVEAKMFIDIIKKLPDGDVVLKLDNTVLCIECGKSKYKLIVQDPLVFPELPEIEIGNEVYIKQAILKQMLKQTIFSVSADESKPALTGELFEIKEKEFNVVSVDGYRISYVSTGTVSEREYNIIIPGKTLTEISKILKTDEDAEAKLVFTATQIIFDLGTCIITSRLIEGKFILYNQVLMQEPNIILKANRTDLIATIERASLLIDEKSKKPITLNIGSDKIHISSKCERGTCNEDVGIEILEGEADFNIAFNPRYIVDALKVVEDEYIKLELVSALAPMLIKPLEKSEEHKDYTYLVLPVRVA